MTKWITGLAALSLAIGLALTTAFADEDSGSPGERHHHHHHDKSSDDTTRK